MSDINQQFRKELYNPEAEQIILGTIILNNEYLNRVSEFLLPEHFYEPAHQKIYSQILHNIEKVNITANQVTLKQFFESEETLKAAGGALYLSTLLASASMIVDIAQYARLIHDLALKRELVMIGEEIVNKAYKTDDRTSADEQIERAETNLFSLTNHGNGRSDFRNISVSLTETLEKTTIARKRDSHISGVSTGLADLDRMLGGMQNSDLIILAGRPSMGKTALAINIAVNACKFLNKNLEGKNKKAVGFFSLEMSADQLAARILSMESSINATKFRTGQLSDMEWEAIAARSAEISKWPFFIDDTPALSIAAIRTRTRRMIRKHNLGLVLVDYLQLVKAVDSRGGAVENRVQEISQITQGLKALAKEFNIPVMALSQLSRAVEQREDKRPQLSDLRESGSIEQDADVVAFIYRESYYHERKQPPEADVAQFEAWKIRMQELRNLSEVMIAKQRNGPVGNTHLFFDAEFTRFGNLDIQHHNNFD